MREADGVASTGRGQKGAISHPRMPGCLTLFPVRVCVSVCCFCVRQGPHVRFREAAQKGLGTHARQDEEAGFLMTCSSWLSFRGVCCCRDDDYLAAAFNILGELQARHVMNREPPGNDPWVGRPGYEDFVQRTVSIAHGAETVLSTPVTPQVHCWMGGELGFLRAFVRS